MKKKLSIVLILLLIFLLGCSKPRTENSLLPLSADEYIELIIPENLLGGKNAKEVIEDFKNGGDLGKERIVTEILANDNGSATFIFTLEQFEAYKKHLYNQSKLEKYYNDPSLKNVIYEDEMLFKITVLVDKAKYINSLFDRSMVNMLLVINAGTYQIFCGTPPDEWHTTITVKDEATGEIISVNEFPNEDMYRVY